MAFIHLPEIVRYACTCGSLKPISRIYFCRHCLKVRCGYCVLHEVDSHYCAHCLENIPSAEARLKKQKCASCFDCPSCLNTLSTRTTVQTTHNPDDPSKTVTRKAYYLSCGCCRWTSRDVGLADQTVASGAWPEKENVFAPRVNALLEYYKALALREKQEKERKKFTPRRSYLVLEKYALSNVGARKRVGLSSLGSSLPLKDDPSKFPSLERAVATEDVDDLPADIFEKPLDLTKITTLTQRLAQPEFQPTKVSQLYPAHKQLLIKRSQRCRSCEHNVSKPEYNPASIKFKIQLSAYYHVPEVRIVTCEPLKIGQRSEFILKLCNPTQHQSTVQFLILPSPDEDLEEWRKEMEEKKKKLEKKESEKEVTFSLSSSLTRQLSMTEEPKPVRVNLTGEVELPTSTVILPPRDDAAEYDDSGDTHNFQDDPKVVVWRKANKAAVKLVVIPTEESKTHDGEVVVGFLMQYTYVNTMATLEQKEPQKVTLKVKIYVTLGKTAISE
ncbi:dynactin subunit 4 [Schistocerca nitens]|uniref:dynactin subunit 4 n=1 Tax=Schistocerca nitens TaxID=7011 RepID=UPI00211927DF|nr:dynactin subunit 4 [Schistocerca nitens]